MSFLELYAWSFWENTRPRKTIAALLVSLVAPFFALLVRTLANDTNRSNTYSLIIQLGGYSFCLVILAILFASSIISSEVTAKTIPYLLTHPVPRAKLLLAKWLGATTLVTIAMMFSAFLTASILYGGDFLASQLPKDLIAIPIASITYCAVCSLLSVLLTRPVLPMVIYVFGLESWIWMLSGDVQKLSIMAHVRAIAGHTPIGASEVTEVIALLNPSTISETTAWNTLVIVTIISLTLGCVIFSKCEYIPKEEPT